MHLTTQERAGTLVITIAEARIDAACAIQFKEAMRSASGSDSDSDSDRANPPARVLLDMSSVDFVDSSGLGAIVAAMKQLGPARRLDLAGLTADVDKVFRLTRMDSVFGIYPTVEAAIGLQGTG